MDLLKQELLRKRRLLAEETGGKKIFRRSKIDQNIQKREQRSVEAKAGPKPITPHTAAANPSPDDDIDLTPPEVIRRLRFLKQPMTLFGEDDTARRDRLKYLLKTAGLFEIDDGDLTTEGRQTNDYILDLELSKIGKNQREVETIKDDGCLCEEDQIRIFLNRQLNEWNQELDEIPESEKRSREGKDMVAKFEQSVRELQPLLESCRKKSLPDDIRRALGLAVESCTKHEYEAATIHYVGLAIGNAPWPIGVTMVGIHERSAREKIFASSVAHIMNDETKRKYLQSFKRLMTFCERRYPRPRD